MDLEVQLFHPFIHSGCQLELSMHHFQTGKKLCPQLLLCCQPTQSLSALLCPISHLESCTMS